MASNMHEIKNRINSVSQTLQITKAMKLISGVKLKHARQQLDETLPYFDRIRIALLDTLLHGDVIHHRGLASNSPTQPNEDSKKAVIVLSGDKGLVGGYNNAIIKLTEQILGCDKNVTLYLVGNSGRLHFNRKKDVKLAEDFNFNVQNPTIYRAREIARRIYNEYMSAKYDEVFIIYTHMVSPILNQQRVLRLLPIDPDSLMLNKEADISHMFNRQDEVRESTSAITEAEFYKKTKDMDRSQFMYEPSPYGVFDHLIPQYMKGIIYGTLVEAFTCEQSARMIAMDNATSNAEDLIADQQLQYNRARQSQITQELSEIIGGATALE